MPELLQAILLVGSGRTYYSPSICRLLNQALHRIRHQEATNGLCSLLTPKEQQVLELVCRQYTTKDICKTLKLTPGTVHTHRRHLLEKTGAKNVVGLVLYAFKEGILIKE